MNQPKSIRQQAEEELEWERTKFARRDAVDKEKDRLRRRRAMWRVIKNLLKPWRLL